MTDRELLEAAAVAADLLFDPTVKIKHGLLVARADEGCQSRTVLWNPLTDDGDALRLAVRLRLHAKHFSPYEDDFDIKPPGMVEVWQEDGEDPLHIEYFKPGDDPLAATRRAIVRAAAEIGGKE